MCLISHSCNNISFRIDVIWFQSSNLGVCVQFDSKTYHYHSSVEEECKWLGKFLRWVLLCKFTYILIHILYHGKLIWVGNLESMYNYQQLSKSIGIERQRLNRRYLGYQLIACILCLSTYQKWNWNHAYVPCTHFVHYNITFTVLTMLTQHFFV